VLLLVSLFVSLSGVASIVIRGPLKPAETALRADTHGRDPIVSALGAEIPKGAYDDDEEERDGHGPVETVAAAGPFAADGATSAGQADSDEDRTGSPTDASIER
jgi:hypothetical protein